MSPTQDTNKDRAALKAAIYDRMMALEAHELEVAKEHYRAYLSDAVMGEGAQQDRSAVAEATESLDLAHSFDHPVQTHQAKVDALENLDFGLKSEVMAGAVVSFSGKNFVVAVSTDAFEVGGERYMGISEQSPIYRAMQGLAEGDSFAFNGKDVMLDQVF
ncbi:hypothetical protein [Chachezhania sediminis]|uniref:hypothetical protein n=1 Tax=Chachezhania sediminis TaxID=2599291 RepID=UPI00131C4CC1|nr:hypothetical protein [Chachezhania sediminis]